MTDLTAPASAAPPLSARWQPIAAAVLLLALWPLANALQQRDGGRTLVFALAIGVALVAAVGSLSHRLEHASHRHAGGGISYVIYS